MQASAVEAILGRLRFTQGLPASTIARLATLASVVEFPADSVVFREGRENSHLYLLTSGRIALEMNVPSRGRVRLLTLGDGDLLGWSAVSGNDRAMTATAVALAPTQAIAFAGAPLQALCESDHEVGYHFLRRLSASLAQRLLATRLQLLDLFAETTAP